MLHCTPYISYFHERDVVLQYGPLDNSKQNEGVADSLLRDTSGSDDTDWKGSIEVREAVPVPLPVSLDIENKQDEPLGLSNIARAES